VASNCHPYNPQSSLPFSLAAHSKKVAGSTTPSTPNFHKPSMTERANASGNHSVQQYGLDSQTQASECWALIRVSYGGSPSRLKVPQLLRCRGRGRDDLVDHAEDHETCVSETLLAEVLVYLPWRVYTCGGHFVRLFSIIMSKHRFTDTHDHGSVRNRHPVRNHKVPIIPCHMSMVISPG
jgi:hypothetical protein